MTRLEHLRETIDRIIENNPDAAMRRSAYTHLYGVSQNCVLLAQKRGLDPELCAIMGMLHDIYSYQFAPTTDHAEKGALLAEEILTALEIVSVEELQTICTAIARHSNKDCADGPYDELLKDADVLQHCMYDPAVPITTREQGRYQAMLHALC